MTKNNNKEIKKDGQPKEQKEKVIVDEEKKKLEEEINNLKEALLRNQAELQNYKRRQQEEMDRILKYRNEDILKEFLPIIDNFERAIKMDDADLSDEVSKFLEGFKIIYTNTINMIKAILESPNT